MLTALIRQKGHEVLSFIENCNEEGSHGFSFEEWIKTPKADQSFEYDTTAAMESDALIYLGPSGKDAAAECGMAYARGVPIIGLRSKGEDFGLMRKMMCAWVDNYREALEVVDRVEIDYTTIER